MRVEIVVDASVLVKCVLAEEDSELALAQLRSGVVAIAPDFILIELASVLAKSVRLGRIDLPGGKQALVDARAFIEEAAASPPLAGRAFDLSARHGISAYDGLYLALAESRGIQLLTADIKLVRRAHDAGFSFVRSLSTFH